MLQIFKEELAKALLRLILISPLILVPIALHAGDDIYTKAQLTAVGTLTRNGDVFTVGAMRFTATGDFNKFLNAKLGRKVTVTVK